MTSKQPVIMGKCYKILLLGPPSSGKTTIFTRVCDEYRLDKDFIHQYEYGNLLEDFRCKVVETMLVLCDMINHYDDNYYILKNHLSVDNADDLEEIGDIMITLWSNAAIKRAYLSRYLYEYKENNEKLMENFDYFIDFRSDYFDEYFEENYTFDMTDILKLKLPPVGNDAIQELKFNAKNNRDDKEYDFHLIDIPHHDDLETFLNNTQNKDALFDNIDGIIYTVPLSDFCKYSCKQNKNALTYCIEYFEKIIKMDRFKTTAISIILTKYDIFGSNIENGYSLSTCFDSWDKNNDFANIRLLTDIIPNMIRNIKIDYGVLIPIDIINLIEKYSTKIVHDIMDKFIDHHSQKYIKASERHVRDVYVFDDYFIDTVDATDEEDMLRSFNSSIRRIVWICQR